jgi:hypothetical protein
MNAPGRSFDDTIIKECNDKPDARSGHKKNHDEPNQPSKTKPLPRGEERESYADDVNGVPNEDQRHPTHRAGRFRCKATNINWQSLLQ